MPCAVEHTSSGYRNHTEGSFVVNANPLKVDPTRTLTIRRRFMAEVNKRFRALLRAIQDFLVEKDALGLRTRASFITMVQPREYEFRTEAGKLTAFHEWLRQQMEADILRPDPGTPIGQPWTTKFIESSYKMGQINAYLATKRAQLLEEAGVGDMSLEQFLKSSFAQPETLSKVQLLATRSFEGMRGITASIGSDLNRILAQGLADGVGPEKIAKEISTSIQSITRKRALVIARTEIINAHAEGQLDAFKELKVKELGVKAEWSTAGDDRVCPQCLPMEGRVFKLDDARGMIPLHPNCRCSWVPFVPKAFEKGKG